MGSYTQTKRNLLLTTPLEADQLLIESFTGQEAISELFQFQLGLLASNDVRIPFEKVVGQTVTVELALPDLKRRYFNGYVRRLTEVSRDKTFTYFQAEVVPAAWLLTQNSTCRVFQQRTVPDILRELFASLDVEYDIRGNYFPHNYCVQYRESDFAFASRIMEEEGIYYYFKHDKNGHKLVVADTSLQAPRIAEPSTLAFDEVVGGRHREPRVVKWSKSQDVRPGKHTLRDHAFQLPTHTLDASASLPSAIRIGSVNHPLQLGNNLNIERFDYPGGYAHRFDGIHPHGSEQTSSLQNVFDDNQRTVNLRMEEQAARSILIEGASDNPNMVAGLGFTLTNHFDGDGDYVLTRVEHSIVVSDFRSGLTADRPYENRFACIPRELAYRPPLVTPEPLIHGTQTATVVGTATRADQEVSCDKYGRVKVQFHWDRAGTNDLNSSCWVRVMQSWAGGGFGSLQLPRIGHEVVVAFEEGDPDAPIILGSVYNADNMPPYKLPDDRAISGFRSRTKTTNSSATSFNHFYFDDTNGNETVRLHSENRLHQSAEKSMVQLIGWGAGTTSGTGGQAEPKSGGDESNDPTKKPDEGEGDDKDEEKEGDDKEKEHESSWEPAKTEKIKGNNLETVWGNNFEFIVGATEEVVIGASLEGILGASVGGIFGVNAEIVVGSNFELVAGGVAEIIIGDNYEWIYGGSSYEYVSGDESYVIGGSYYEKVMGKHMATMFNGKVVEYLDATSDAEYKRMVFNGIDSFIETKSPAAQAIIDAAKNAALNAAVAIAVAALNPTGATLNATINQETARLTPTFDAAFNAGYTIISEGGDIKIGNLKHGGKVTLQADTIEILCNTWLLKYTTNGDGRVDNAAAKFTEGEAVLETIKAKIETQQDVEAAFVDEHLTKHGRALGKALAKAGITAGVCGAAAIVGVTEASNIAPDYFKD